MVAPDTPKKRERLLATDLDGTLVGHPHALALLKQVLGRYREQWALAYVTGRSLASARRLQAAEQLPEPDVWITEVGTIITDADGRADDAWRQKLAAHWDRAQVELITGGLATLRPQPPEGQGPFKVSFFVEPQAASQVFPVLKSALARAKVQARLVYSSDRDLDVVPAGAGKGEAVLHVLRRWGIPLENLLACGDSGNDRDMLCLGGPAVAVGNAQPELLADLPEEVLKAKGACAAGILEALGHYEWIGRDECHFSSDGSKTTTFL